MRLVTSLLVAGFIAPAAHAATFTYDYDVFAFDPPVPANTPSVFSYGDVKVNNAGTKAYTQVNSDGAGTTTEVLIRSDLGVIVSEGMVMPDSGGFTLSNIGTISMNNSGDIVFEANLEGGGADNSNNMGVYSYSGGVLSKVFQLGDPAPDTGGGVFKLFDSAFLRNLNPVITDSGSVMISTRHSDPGSAILTDPAIFEFDAANTGTRRVAPGDAGTPAGTNVGDSLQSFVTANGAGQIAFTGDTDVGFGNDAIFLDQPGSTLDVVISEAGTFGGEAVSSVDPGPTINEAGVMLFDLTTADMGVFTEHVVKRAADGTLTTLLTVGQATSLGGLILDSFSPIDINLGEQVLFTGSFSDGMGGSETNGVFMLDSNGDISHVLDTDESFDHMGTAWDIQFLYSFNISDDLTRTKLFNDAGQVALKLFLRDPGSGDFANALVLADPTAVPPNVVPVPASLPMLLLGLAGLMRLRKRSL